MYRRTWQHRLHDPQQCWLLCVVPGERERLPDWPTRVVAGVRRDHAYCTVRIYMVGDAPCSGSTGGAVPAEWSVGAAPLRSGRLLLPPLMAAKPRGTSSVDRGCRRRSMSWFGDVCVRAK